MSHTESTAPGIPGEPRKPRRFFSLEARAAIIAANKRRTPTPEYVAKQRAAKLGKRRPVSKAVLAMAEEWLRDFESGEKPH
jgi:hypothetical protein